MATISSEYIQTVIESLREGLLYLGPSEYGDASDRRDQILSVVGFSVIEDPDLLFALLLRGVSSLVSVLDSVEDALDSIDDLLPDLSRTNTPIESVTEFISGADALQTMVRNADAFGRVPNAKKQQFTTSVNTFLEKLKPSIKSGSVATRTSHEVRLSIPIALSTIHMGWNYVLEYVPLFVDAMRLYTESNVEVSSVRSVLRRVQEEYGRIKNEVESAAPSARANGGTEYLVYLLAMRDLVNDLSTPVDPTMPKVDKTTVQAVGNGTPATMLGTASGDFQITSTNDQFTLTLNAGSPQTHTLPHSNKAVLQTALVENYVITAATAASVSAVTSAPYANTIRTNAVDGAVTNGNGVFTSASATFVGTVQIGDHISMSGAYTGVAYVVAVLNNTTLLLDTNAAATAAGVTYTVYADNRFRISVDGSLQTVALTPGAAVAYTTWETELNAGLTGVSVSNTAGLISITSLSTGINSRLLVLSSDTQSLMGFPTVVDQGDASNQSLVVSSSTGGPQTLLMTAGTYTAATMATMLNTLATSSIWSADSDSGYLQLLSAGEGQNAWVSTDNSNPTLGYVQGQSAYGSPISVNDVVEHMNTNDTIGAVYTYETQIIMYGYSLQTVNGSQDVTDSTVSFDSVPVEINDVLRVTSGGNAGVYSVSSVSPTVLSLAATDYLSASAVSETNVSYVIERTKIRISSQDTSTDSSITIGAGTANSTLGFTGTARGKHTTFQVLEDGTPIDLELVGINADRDELVSNSPALTTDVVDVDGVVMTVQDAQDNNFSSTDFGLYSKAARSYATLANNLDNWTSTQLPRVTDGAVDLSTVVSFVERAIRNPSPVYTGEAQSELNVYRSVLLDSANGLRTKLTEYEAPLYDGYRSLVQMLKEENQSKMIRDLETGKYDEAFSYAAQIGGQEEHLSELLRQAGRVLPDPQLEEIQITLRSEEIGGTKND